MNNKAALHVLKRGFVVQRLVYRRAPSVESGSRATTLPKSCQPAPIVTELFRRIFMRRNSILCGCAPRLYHSNLPSAPQRRATRLVSSFSFVLLRFEYSIVSWRERNASVVAARKAVVVLQSHHEIFENRVAWHAEDDWKRHLRARQHRPGDGRRAFVIVVDGRVRLHVSRKTWKT